MNKSFLNILIISFLSLLCCKKKQIPDNFAVTSDSDLNSKVTKEEDFTLVFKEFLSLKLELKKKSIEILEKENIDIKLYEDLHNYYTSELTALCARMSKLKIMEINKNDIKLFIQKNEAEYDILVQRCSDLVSKSGLDLKLGEASYVYKKYALEVENPLLIRVFGGEF
jgi:hypothetical protein